MPAKKSKVVIKGLFKLFSNINTLLIIGSVLLYVLILYFAFRTDSLLGRSELITGYSLLFVIIFLIVFNFRKRLSVLPIIKVSHWTRLHMIQGCFCLILFFAHTKTLIPLGVNELVLSVFFYISVITGLIGYFLNKTIPRRLTESNIEVIFEKIPSVISDLRDQVESIIIECAKENNTDTLTRHHIETLNWFFVRPRFFLDHLFGGQRGRHWVDNQVQNIQHYLNDSEKQFLMQIHQLAQYKNKIDFHYSLQSCTKAWLFVHIPVSVMMLILVIWHLLIVNIYAI